MYDRPHRSSLPALLAQMGFGHLDNPGNLSLDALSLVGALAVREAQLSSAAEANERMIRGLKQAADQIVSLEGRLSGEVAYADTQRARAIRAERTASDALAQVESLRQSLTTLRAKVENLADVADEVAGQATVAVEDANNLS